MVGMSVRDADEANIRWFNANRRELRLQRLGARPVNARCRGVPWEPAVRHGGDVVGDAGVPEKISLRVVDQVAATRDVDRFPYVHAHRPARLIRSVPLTAIKHIEPVHALLLGLCPARASHAKSGESHKHDHDSLHGKSSLSTNRILWYGPPRKNSQLPA